MGDGNGHEDRRIGRAKAVEQAVNAKAEVERFREIRIAEAQYRRRIEGRGLR